MSSSSGNPPHRGHEDISTHQLPGEREGREGGRGERREGGREGGGRRKIGVGPRRSLDYYYTQQLTRPPFLN